MIMNKHIIVHDLGLVNYQDALDYQLRLFNQIIKTVFYYFFPIINLLYLNIVFNKLIVFLKKI